MTLNLSGLKSIAPIQLPEAPVVGSSATKEGSFQDVLASAIDHVETTRADANKKVTQFLSGEGDDLHSTILAGQRADLEFQMFLQVRNKVVSAYQEVMRMQM
jgi:flagellar hook-basal body complex protein FliE